eukprot:921671_1
MATHVPPLFIGEVKSEEIDTLSTKNANTIDDDDDVDTQIPLQPERIYLTQHNHLIHELAEYNQITNKTERASQELSKKNAVDHSTEIYSFCLSHTLSIAVSIYILELISDATYTEDVFGQCPTSNHGKLLSESTCLNPDFDDEEWWYKSGYMFITLYAYDKDVGRIRWIALFTQGVMLFGIVMHSMDFDLLVWAMSVLFVLGLDDWVRGHVLFERFVVLQVYTCIMAVGIACIVSDDVEDVFSGFAEVASWFMWVLFSVFSVSICIYYCFVFISFVLFCFCYAYRTHLESMFAFVYMSLDCLFR